MFDSFIYRGFPGERGVLGRAINECHAEISIKLTAGTKDPIRSKDPEKR